MSDQKLIERFLTSNQKLYVLVSAYLTLVLIGFCVNLFEVELDQSKLFMIGEATAKGVDISARISMFYKMSALGFISFGIFYIIISKLTASFWNQLLRINEFKSLLAIQVLLSFISFFTEQKIISNELFHLGILGLFVLEFIEFIRKKRSVFLVGDVLKSFFLIAASLILITENVFISATVLFLITPILSAQKSRSLYASTITTITALPVLLFLTVELTLILNQNGFYDLYYWYTGLIILAIWMMLIRLIKIKNQSDENLIFRWQAPLIIVGVAIFSAYRPVYFYDNSLFELANNMNPLMMSEVFHSTYFVDYISSHLLNDFVFMKLYALLNGYQHEMAPLIYYGFSWVCYTLTIYYFLRVYFKQQFGIVFLMLFTPYLFFYFPHSYAFALIPVIFLHKFFTTQNKRFLWWFALTAAATVFWRLDLGVATIGASLVVYLFTFLFEKNIRRTLMIIGIVFTAVFGALFTWYYINCSELIHEALHYFGGSQGHGISELTENYSNLFYFDYFILPVLVLFCALILLIRNERLREIGFFYPILFLIGFYFFNFQRGLVRHSFIEMNETYISSFGWLIIGLFVYEFTSRKLTVFALGYAVAGGFLFSIHSLDFSVSLFDREKSFSVNELPKINGEKLNRSPENYDYGKYTKPVVTFLRENLNQNETFFDFSNSPMLYYHTEKRIPAYFSQSLQYIVDLYLQNKCVEKLKTQKIPLVVFNQTVNSFGDNIDDIPNKVRYHYIASYLLGNYVPSKEYGLFHIWRSKGQMPQDSTAHPVQVEHWNLGLIPYYWKANPTEPNFKFKRRIEIESDKASLGKIEHGDFINLKINAKQKGQFKLWMEIENQTNFYVSFEVKAGTFEYKFPLCSSYYLRAEQNPVIEYALEEGQDLKQMQIVNQRY